jgi:hypothetical protein
VIGGTFRALGGSLGPRSPTPALTHFTDEAGAAGIQSSGALRGGQGIYTLPSTAVDQARWVRFLRTLVAPSRTSQAISIPPGAGGQFIQPAPVGPVSMYQYLVGVYRAPAGAISMSTGAFAPGGRVLGNVTGQFWPYGVDAMIWLSAAAMSPASEDAGERGVTGALGLPSSISDLVSGPPLPVTSLEDGPFIELPIGMLPLDEAAILSAAEAGEDPIRGVCEAPAPEDLQSHPEEFTPAEQPTPALILVYPDEQAAFAESPVGAPG